MKIGVKMDISLDSTGFEQYSTEILIQIHENLINGINEVSKSLNNGTFHVVGEKGTAPPSQSGQTTLVFLKLVSLELAKRNIPSSLQDLAQLELQNG